MPGPWREVTYIEDVAPRNAKEGGSWCLTLECGHITFRSKPRPTLTNAIGLLTGRRRLSFAPKKARCLTCHLRADRPER